MDAIGILAIILVLCTVLVLGIGWSQGWFTSKSDNSKEDSKTTDKKTEEIKADKPVDKPVITGAETTMGQGNVVRFSIDSGPLQLCNENCSAGLNRLYQATVGAGRNFTVKMFGNKASFQLLKAADSTTPTGLEGYYLTEELIMGVDQFYWQLTAKDNKWLIGKGPQYWTVAPPESVQLGSVGLPITIEKLTGSTWTAITTIADAGLPNLSGYYIMQDNSFVQLTKKVGADAEQAIYAIALLTPTTGALQGKSIMVRKSVINLEDQVITPKANGDLDFAAGAQVPATTWTLASSNSNPMMVIPGNNGAISCSAWCIEQAPSGKKSYTALAARERSGDALDVLKSSVLGGDGYYTPCYCQEGVSNNKIVLPTGLKAVTVLGKVPISFAAFASDADAQWIWNAPVSKPEQRGTDNPVKIYSEFTISTMARFRTVLLTMQSLATEVKVYLNGTLVTTFTPSGTSVVSSVETGLCIGGRNILLLECTCGYTGGGVVATLQSMSNPNKVLLTRTGTDGPTWNWRCLA